MNLQNLTVKEVERKNQKFQNEIILGWEENFIRQYYHFSDNQLDFSEKSLKIVDLNLKSLNKSDVPKKTVSLFYGYYLSKVFQENGYECSWNLDTFFNNISGEFNLISQSLNISNSLDMYTFCPYSLTLNILNNSNKSILNEYNIIKGFLKIPNV